MPCQHARRRADHLQPALGDAADASAMPHSRGKPSGLETRRAPPSSLAQHGEPPPARVEGPQSPPLLRAEGAGAEDLMAEVARPRLPGDAKCPRRSSEDLRNLALGGHEAQLGQLHVEVKGLQVLEETLRGPGQGADG